jgi:hypothetical protein
MKTKFTTFVIISFLVGSFVSSCSQNKFKSSEYISTTGSAQPGQETRIELEDGAAIVVPANSLREEVHITVERNPEKINDLPPTDDNAIQLGDFYNFEIEGELTGPVDLVLPFDESRIPEENGVMIFARPNEDGWEYIPVIPDGNTVTLYTNNVGDPLVMWHFENEEIADKDRIQFNFCDPKITAYVLPEEGLATESFTVIGRVRLPGKKLIDKMSDAITSFILGKDTSETVGRVPIEIIVNSNPLRTIGGLSEPDGSFSFDINPEEDALLDIAEGLNHLEINAVCDAFLTDYKTTSTGNASFTVLAPIPGIIETEEVAEQPEPEPIPEGAVMLPYFVGKSFDEATDWLEKNGFGYTWVDGSSPYDVGFVFDQAPASGQYKVPHRTIVVLHRTNETVIIPTIEPTVDICSSLNLTLEECANAGTHEYLFSTNIGEVIFKQPHDNLTCGGWSLDPPYRIEFTFFEGGVEKGNNNFVKVSDNTYKGNYPVYNEGDERIAIFTFRQDGFTLVENSIHATYGCKTTVEMILR